VIKYDVTSLYLQPPCKNRTRVYHSLQVGPFCDCTYNIQGQLHQITHKKALFAEV